MDEKIRKLIGLLIEVLFSFILIYSPIAFGSVAFVYRPPIWMVSSLLLVLVIIYQWRFPYIEPILQEQPVYKKPLVVYWLFGGYLALMLIHLIPLPEVLLRMASEFNHERGAVFGPLHPHPEAGLRRLICWFSTFALFYSATAFPFSRVRVRRIIFVILGVAGFEAIYGLIEYAGGHQHIFNYTKIAYLDSATGTFVNRNHFANYMGMALCLSFGVISFYWAKTKNGINGKGRPVEPVILLSFLSVLLGAALLFSRSRAGIISVFIALIFAGLFFITKKRWRYFITVAMIVVAAIVLAFWLGKDPTPDRFLDIPAEVSVEDSRPAVWKESLIIWRENPIVGTGPGTFENIFRINNRSRILARYQHAHNDYLEALVENGIVGFILLFSAIGLTLFRTIRGLRSRKSRMSRFYGQALFLAALVLLFHSLFDFNLRIPANRLTFFAILGLGYLVSNGRMRR